jgi:hypothetical protein
MHEFGASYDEEMEADWNKIMQKYHEGIADLEDIMRVEGTWRMKLTYQILKSNIIEKCGFIEPALFKGSRYDSLQELCRRIKEHTNVNEKVVYDTIRDFAWRGYLTADISDKGCQWSWSTL